MLSLVSCASDSVSDVGVLGFLMFEQVVVDVVGDSTPACDTNRWGVGGLLELNTEDESVKGRGEVCGRWFNRGRCELGTESKRVGLGLKACALVEVLCKGVLDITLKEKFAALNRSFFSSTVLPFFKATLKPLCFRTLSIASSSILLMRSLSSCVIGVPLVQNWSF